MDHVDALLFLLLAMGDMVLLAYLRKRRARRIRMERMAKALAEAVRRELLYPVRRRVVRAAEPAPAVAEQSATVEDDRRQNTTVCPTSYATVQ